MAATHDMTQGKPLKVIFTFFFPLLLGNLFQQFYSAVDSMIVGRYVGVEAFAGISATGSVNFMILGFMMGLGYSRITMVAGIFEMIGRTFVAFVLVGPFGFKGACFANPSAWIMAIILLIPVYFRVMKKLEGQHTQEKILSNQIH